MRSPPDESPPSPQPLAGESAMLAAVVEQSPAFICVLRGPDHVFELANEQYRILVGRERTLIGKPLREAFDAVEIGPYIELLDRVYQTGEPYVGHEMPTDLWRGNDERTKERRFLNFVYQPMRESDGSVSGILVHGVDVTELVLGRNALRESEERLRLGLEAGGTGLWDWDIRRNRVTWSDRIYVFHGIERDEFDGTVEGFAKLVHPEDAKRVVGAIEQAIATRGAYEIEFRILRPYGEVRWLSTAGQAYYDDAGQPVRMLGATRDITDRKRDENSLRELRDRVDQQARLFDQIASTTPDFIYTFGRDYRVLYANRRLLEVWGKSFEEAVGKGLSELGYPDWHVAMHHRELRQVIETKQPVKGEVPFTGGSGIFGVYEYIFTPVLGPDGEVEIIAGTTRDVTHRKLTEKELADANVRAELSVARWQAIVGNMSEGVVLADGEGTVLEVNPAAIEMYGLASLDDARRSRCEISPAVELRDAADNSVVLPERYPIARVVRGEQFARWEGRIRRFDGTRERDISFSGTPIRDRDGKIIFALVTLHDVTVERRAVAALRESEQRFRAVVETTPECVKIIGPDGELIYMNAAGLCMIEAPSMTAVAGSSIYGVISPEHRDEWIRQHKRVCAGEKLSWEFEVTGLRGTRCWMESHAVPITLSDGRFGQLAVTREIGTRKAAEREREALLFREQAARAEAELSNRMKDEFLATLSHELRTPMSAIVGWSQILQRDPKPHTLAQGLETIVRNARAQTQIIEDLLDMSRIVSGKIRLDVQRVDLATVIHAAIETVRHAAEAKGVRLISVLDSSAGLISGDPNRLQQVFWNLLTNAVKFTPRGGRVQVVLERVSSHVEVSVIDTGEGIHPEFLPFVFDRFRQADASTTRRHGGLGLGLSIVKQLVELHGGEVRVKSPGEGMGSTFVVALPLTAVGVPADGLISRGPLHTHHEAGLPLVEACSKVTGLRVLVVDDESDARTLISRLLTDCEASVTTAATADEAVEALRTQRPDVVVSDIGMPDEDGYSMIRRIRALSADDGGAVPAVALTAYARSEDRIRALNAGFQSHVAKPVDPFELVAVLASVARRNPS